MSTPPASTPRPGRVRLFRAILALGMLAIFAGFAVTAELGARRYERNRTRPPDYFPQMYYHHERLGYGLAPNYDYYGWFKINSLGFRGREFPAQKPPGTFRIICLGGSTTFDIGSIGSARPWPEVMESALRENLGTDSIEVLNLGIPGATSLDSLIDLQIRALYLQPDLLVVYQGLNDFAYSMPGPPSEETAWRPLEAKPRSAFMHWLRKHSVLLAKTEGRIGAALRSLIPGGAAAPLVDDGGKSLAEGLAGFEANLTSIAAIAQVNDISLALPEVVLPFPQDAPPTCGVCSRLSSVLGNTDPDRIKKTFAGYSQALLEVASQSPGVHPISTAGFVPSEDRYYHDPVHFGPEGSMAMGVRMAEALEPIIRARREGGPTPR